MQAPNPHPMRSSKLNSPGMSPVASLNARSIGSGPQA